MITPRRYTDPERAHRALEAHTLVMDAAQLELAGTDSGRLLWERLNDSELLNTADVAVAAVRVLVAICANYGRTFGYATVAQVLVLEQDQLRHHAERVSTTIRAFEEAAHHG